MSENTTPSLGELDQIAFVVSDLDRAVIFLRDQVGLKLLFQLPPGLAFFQCGSVRLMVTQPEGERAAGANSTLYFKVADIDAEFAAMQARGITFEDEPHMIANMPDHELWMVFFRDPDGSLLGLMCEKR
jgi:methylmalonyl-CoA/ethylmalonyl-CoA epimerase|uniref:VOC family protein n=1 Tax=Cephaloticoccus sp. TaxID=1985742 RepID=UPI004049D938